MQTSLVVRFDRQPDTLDAATREQAALQNRFRPVRAAQRCRLCAEGAAHPDFIVIAGERQPFELRYGAAHLPPVPMPGVAAASSIDHFRLGWMTKLDDARHLQEWEVD